MPQTNAECKCQTRTKEGNTTIKKPPVPLLLPPDPHTTHTRDPHTTHTEQAHLDTKHGRLARTEPLHEAADAVDEVQRGGGDDVDAAVLRVEGGAGEPEQEGKVGVEEEVELVPTEVAHGGGDDKVAGHHRHPSHQVLVLGQRRPKANRHDRRNVVQQCQDDRQATNLTGWGRGRRGIGGGVCAFALAAVVE